MIKNLPLWKNIKYCIWVMTLAVSLNGCNLIASSGLSESDEELVAEYAAGVIMRYSADSNGGFGNPRPTPVPITALPTTIPSVSESDMESTGLEDDVPVQSDSGEYDVDGTQAIGNVSNIAEAIGIDGLDISYSGIEIVDVYPKTTEESFTFSMQAEEGNKLMVVHFNVANISEQAVVCDMMDKDIKFRALVNGSLRVNEQMTILLNDLKSYSETLEVGQVNDAVLVFSVDEDTATQVNTLDLIVKEGDKESSFSLF
ncbi:MAG: hypothetical protein K6E98_06935 [Lachnospiraceae bacterium]|nr:hypothetical protein [Lachnospiraceae bacterium]